MTFDKKKHPYLIFLILLIASTITAPLYALDEIHVPEAGAYEIRAFIKPTYEKIKSKIILTPVAIDGFVEKILPINNSSIADRYFLNIDKKQSIIIDWKYNGKNNINNFNSYSDYTFLGNFAQNKLYTSHLLYLDTNNDNNIDTIINIGDIGYIVNALQSRSYPFKANAFSQKTFKQKVLHKLNLHTYRDWKYSPVGATFAMASPGVFKGTIHPDGYLALQKDFSHVDLAANYIIKASYRLASTIQPNVYINFILKSKGLFGKTVVITGPVIQNNKQYVLNCKNYFKTQKINIEDYQLQEMALFFVNDDSQDTGNKKTLKKTLENIHCQLELFDISFAKPELKEKNIKVRFLGQEYFQKHVIADLLSAKEDGNKVNSVVADERKVNMVKMRTVLENDAVVKKELFFKNFIVNSHADHLAPKVFTSGLGAASDNDYSDRLVDAKLAISPVRYFLIQNKTIPLSSKDIAKYAKRLVTLQKYSINRSFNEEIVISADYHIRHSKTSKICEIPMLTYIKINGTADGQLLGDMYPATELLKLKYNNMYIDSVEILVMIGIELSTISDYSDLVLKINDISINALSYTTLPEAIVVSDLAIAILDSQENKKRINRELSLPEANIKKRFNIQALLSKEDIIYGGKWISLGFMDFNKEDVAFSAVNSSYFSIDSVMLVKDNLYLFPSQEKDSLQSKTEQKSSLLLKIFKFVIVLLAIAFCVFVVKIIKRKDLVVKSWALIDELFAIKTVFYSCQAFLICWTLYLFSAYKAKSDFSFGLIIALIAFSLWTRYYIRPKLAKKWAYFAEKASAIYFITAITGLMFTALLLIGDKNRAAEMVAVLVYFLLIEGVFIEIKMYIANREEVGCNDTL